MQIRKWLALLVSAALALSLLAGCGNGSKALSDVIADLLSGQYANVTVEIDPDLEADLRQAVHEGETDAEIRAALEKILGSGVSFRLIGDGQQGDSAWDLILYPGSDPDAAARSAFTEWNKVFGSLPRDGQYTAQIAMIETENGYAILVKATVDKAASRDDDDDDDDDDEPEKPYSVTMTDNKVTEVTVDAGAGFQDVLFGEGSSDSEDEEEKALADARADGFAGVTIELATGSYSVDSTFTTSFKGILQGKDKASTIIKLTDGDGLFAQIDTNGIVKNITFEIEENISNTYSYSNTTTAGAVADQNNGTITNCDVTINGGSITATNDMNNDVYAGGIAGENHGKISDCKVTINAGGSITATNSMDVNVCAGGIAGENGGTITNCDVTINAGGSITATTPNGIDGKVYAGGIAGENGGTISKCTVNGGDTTPADISAVNGDMFTCAGGIAGYNHGNGTVDEYCSVSNCKIKAGDYGERIAAGGIVGRKESGNVNCGPATDCYITATAWTGASATVTSGSDGAGAIDSDVIVAKVYAGTSIGFDDGKGEDGGPVG